MKNLPKSRGTEPEAIRRKSGRGFQQLLNDGGLRPEVYLLNLLRDESLSKAERVDYAVQLMPYSVPKLQAIEAEVSNVVKSHEDMLKDLDQDGEYITGETLQ